jgi:uncharacterized protein (TIGR02452 family)
MNVPEKLDLPQLTLEEQLMDRDKAYTLGHETLMIAEQGWYINTKGHTVDIQALRDAATHGRVAYRPGQTPTVGESKYTHVHTFMQKQTALTVAALRISQGHSVAILNFASATTPGGGWLAGARVQEESLARSSTMVYALRSDPMYTDRTLRDDGFYSDTVIVTPKVPFFRHQNGQILDTPWLADVITCAAVNARKVRDVKPERAAEIEPAMRRRIHKVFQVATTLDADILILGAWGCGAFGNDPEVIAQIMHEMMDIVDMRRFVAIDFAVADLFVPQVNYPPFATRFDGRVFGG